MMSLLAGASAVLAGLGAAQAGAGAWLVSRFARRTPVAPRERPGVTLLKPLHGDEPLLEEALATACAQDYPVFQIVFGVQGETDPAIAVVRRLRERFPSVDMALVVDPAVHGMNRKVGNLMNMFPAARHDILVIADSDVHVRPDYLDRLVAALEQPDVGLVTTLYVGLPAARPGRARPPVAARLGASQITHGFLPGAVLSRALGRQDCLGASMCLRRRDLARIGGLATLVDHLADDNVLGRRIAGLGLRVALADTVPLTTVPEQTLGALFRHELRWARTIRALEPVGFGASALQHALAWGALAVVLAGGAPWSWGFFLFLWAVRAAAAGWVDGALARFWRDRAAPGRVVALAFSCPVWLLPFRDLLSVAVMLASYGGRRVDWRGQGLFADTPPPMTPASNRLRPIQDTNAR